MAVVGPLLMTLFVASIVGGVYVYFRTRTFSIPGGETDTTTDTNDTTDGADTTDVSEPDIQDTPGTGPPDRTRQDKLLDVLPDDEHRILEPVIESPGLTQIKVRDRSDFSRSKVSQTITDLEERGLLYREPQGRTYRVYPAEDLNDRH
jgi:predicted transcriptional regulator